MKSDSGFYKSVCMIVILMTLSSLSFQSVSETSDSARAVVDAKNDVREPILWLAGSLVVSSGMGCIGGSGVILASQLMTPTPPPDRLLGKSSEYVSFYIATYENETKNKRLIYSTAGCVGGTLVAVLLVGRFTNQIYDNLEF